MRPHAPGLDAGAKLAIFAVATAGCRLIAMVGSSPRAIGLVLWLIPILAAWLALPSVLFWVGGRLAALAPSGRLCPSCQSGGLTLLGRKNRSRYYRCGECRRVWRYLGPVLREVSKHELDKALAQVRLAPDALISPVDASTCGQLLGRKRVLDHRTLTRPVPVRTDDEHKVSVPVLIDAGGGTLAHLLRIKQRLFGGQPVTPPVQAEPPLWDRWLDD